MTDKETDAVKSAEMSDDQLEQAVGGLLVKPVTPVTPQRKKSGDPCEGGQ